jgi:hypothetical protein
MTVCFSSRDCCAGSEWAEPQTATRRWLSQTLLDFSDFLHQYASNSVRAAHAVCHQAYVRWANSQVLRYASVEPLVQFMNLQQTFSVQFSFRVSRVPHGPPPQGIPQKMPFRTPSV